jgi:hypothetical protein
MIAGNPRNAFSVPNGLARAVHRGGVMSAM